MPEIKLSIEIDGRRHYTEIGQEYDNHRTEFLKSCGVTEMSFTNQFRKIYGLPKQIYDSVWPWEYGGMEYLFGFK